MNDFYFISRLIRELTILNGGRFSSIVLELQKIQEKLASNGQRIN